MKMLLPDNMNQAPRILVVSREPSVLTLLQSVAEANSWTVESAFSRWEALELVQSEDAPGLVLLDLVQSDADGLHTLHWLRRIRPDLPVIVLSHSENGSQPFAWVHMTTFLARSNNTT
jgi:DNA-binding response OmpR family regulator